MENFYKYRVAGHIFEIGLPDGFSREKYLSSYEPFLYEGTGEVLFSLKAELKENLHSVSSGRLTECFNDEPPFLWLFEDGEYYFGFSYSRKHPDCILIPADGFRKNVVYITCRLADKVLEFAVSNAMMLLYACNTIMYDTLLIHSSVTVHDGAAYSFLGKSGTGKSTHSRLWLQHIPGSYLLNDDNPVTRVVDGDVFVYGSPWSGKTPCYKNEVYPLGGIVRLVQAPSNRISRLGLIQSYASLLPSCSNIKWSRAHSDALHKTVESVVAKVPCWNLECLPDSDAAIICRDAVCVH